MFISSSTLHGLLTFPEIQNILVPVFFSLPKEANHLPPLLRIVGTTAMVSTLLIIVGHPYKPINAGKGGFNLGKVVLILADLCYLQCSRVMLSLLHKYKLLHHNVYKYLNPTQFQPHFFQLIFYKILTSYINITNMCLNCI